jgi:hypothetical protein
VSRCGDRQHIYHQKRAKDDATGCSESARRRIVDRLDRWLVCRDVFSSFKADRRVGDPEFDSCHPDVAQFVVQQ